MRNGQFDIQRHKNQLRSYFNGEGFDRWSAIYGDSQDLSSIRLSIREGHTRMMSQADLWLNERHLPPEAYALDAGCGTGLVSVALAKRGLSVTAVDIAPQMVKAAREQAALAGVLDRIHFVASDLENIGGFYDVVICFDVLIHYPQAGFAALCTRLANLCSNTLILTYAPYNRLLALKHWVGGFFPRSHRRTTIQMIPEHFVRQTLEAAGMHVHRSERISHGFYHVGLIEAHRRG